MGFLTEVNMIEIKGLSKVFGPIVAVDNISFKVEKGDVFGFLGPNGAGKSTTMKMITCFIPPTSGDATLCGHSILTDPISVRRNIGYMPENAPLYGDLSVEQFLKYMAGLRDIPANEVKNSIDRVIELCALDSVYYQPIETLSKGYKRRVCLAHTIIHDPPILILDEPTDGLDPNQKFDVRELIKKMAPEKSIILSTHILEEMEAVCNRATIINKGKILFYGTPEELKSKSDKGKPDDVFRAFTTKSDVQGVTL
jgi:ABC-2 type transport system ATP-binding protein